MNAPVLDTHEDPSGHAVRVFVESPRPGEDTLHTARRHQLDFDVASPFVLRLYGDRDVLEFLQVGRLEVVRRDDNLGRRTFGCHRQAFPRTLRVREGDRRLPPRLRLDEVPGLGSFDDGPRVELAEAVLVVVPPPRRGHLPVWVVRVDLDGRPYAEVLHVSPGQLRADLEDERKDAGCDRSGSRSASVAVGAGVLADIGRVLRQSISVSFEECVNRRAR
jgi:hypothetical protein